MKHSILTILCAAALLGAGNSAAFAHGGTYVGPGDVTPPGGKAPPGSTPTPPGKTPPSGPPTGPTDPGTPSTPNLPNPPTPPGGIGGTGPITSGSVDTTDYASWQFWWEFNKHRFLNLRAKVHGGASTEGQGVLNFLGGPKPNRAPSEPQIRNVLLPALHAAARGEKDQDILTAVMIGLARTGRDDGRASALFTQQLRSPSREVAETAALAFGILQDAGALESVLLPLVNDDAEGQALVGKSEVPMRTRAYAAYAMALIGGSTTDADVQLWVLRHLLHSLETDRSAAQDLRVAAAVGIGLLRPADPRVAAEAVERLTAILQAGQQDDLVLAHLPNSMAKLLHGLPANNLILRDRVLDATLALLEPRAKPGAYLEQSAVMTLGLLARPQDPRSGEIFAALQKAAAGAKDKQARFVSAISLAYLGAADPDFDAPANQQPVTRALVQGLNKNGAANEAWCGLALGVQAFLLAEQGRPAPLAASGALLAKFEEERAPDPLSAYAIGLGLMRHGGAAQPIRARLDSVRDTGFLGYGALALGLLRAREHADALLELIESKKRDPEILRQAAIGLGLMQEPRVLQRLMEYLAPAGGRPVLSVLAASAVAIGFIGDTASVEPLAAFLQNPKLTPLGRAFAAAALGMIGDQSLLPWNAGIGEDLNYRASVPTLVDPSSSAGVLDLL